MSRLAFWYAAFHANKLLSTHSLILNLTLNLQFLYVMGQT